MYTLKNIVTFLFFIRFFSKFQVIELMVEPNVSLSVLPSLLLQWDTVKRLAVPLQGRKMNVAGIYLKRQ